MLDSVESMNSPLWCPNVQDGVRDETWMRGERLSSEDLLLAVPAIFGGLAYVALPQMYMKKVVHGWVGWANLHISLCGCCS